MEAAGGPDPAQWFQQRVQVLIKSLRRPQELSPDHGGSSRTALRSSLGGRLRQYAPRLKRLFSSHNEDTMMVQEQQASMDHQQHTLDGATSNVGSQVCSEENGMLDEETLVQQSLDIRKQLANYVGAVNANGFENIVQVDNVLHFEEPGAGEQNIFHRHLNEEIEEIRGNDERVKEKMSVSEDQRTVLQELSLSGKQESVPENQISEQVIPNDVVELGEEVSCEQNDVPEDQISEQVTPIELIRLGEEVSCEQNNVRGDQISEQVTPIDVVKLREQNLSEQKGVPEDLMPEQADVTSEVRLQDQSAEEILVRTVVSGLLEQPGHIDRLVLQDGTAEGQGSGVPSIVLEEPKDKLQLQLNLSPVTAGAGVSSARKSPVTVQEWVDSLPAPVQRSEDDSEEPPVEDAEDVLDLGLGAEAGLLYDVACPMVTIIRPQAVSETKAKSLAREPSVQSDNSHGSSVESYLESRKPDPEEVLMSLGFGGHGSTLDSEVSRIPRRFLQPSKVKGVAIEDFLRYQQDLIETFETGFSGYHGLTGSSDSIPSVIVAKIMEKLREHERESCTSGGTPDRASPPPQTGGKQRFSSVARRVLKRTSVLGAIPSRQPATLSVLNDDNRRFLESQGAKSPEVPRKRMVIGHRSYTFGCDGEMIEVTKPKPLVHKDSVLSSATSLSLTSVDSDSDIDDRSDNFELQRHSRLPLVPDSSTETMEPTSPNPADRPLHSTIGKRMSSTSLSSWESDSVTPDSPVLKSKFHRSRFYLPSTSPDQQMKYESIDEDAEVKKGSDVEKADSVFRPDTEDTVSRRGSLKRQQHISEEELMETNTHLNIAPDPRGDSFEMEEISALEEDAKHAPLSRARSDSSGFLEGDSESRDVEAARLRGGDATGKRSSLPIVRVHDERGSLLNSRSCSLHSLGSSSGSGCDRLRCRSLSAPNGLSLGGSWSSVSNMFSSCSDESVIHTGVGAPSIELQELLRELAGRGLSLSPVPPQTPRCAYKEEAEAVRLALGAYSSQLVGGTSSLDVLDRGPPEARRELQAVREIRGQIAAELRRVAALLEEQPGPRAAAITRQMTALLREQTRLCRQLESLSHGASEMELPPMCCNSERLLGAVREENRRLERLVESHSQELTEIRQLLQELVSRRS
ncbi:uncharacterized protein olf186-M isoform X2 [Anabrus simplex]|uniref:uncharacterized protein olf186-M isoform X2 n=1 Tax=Anabrus simplex TaxID=316456 RepID=UPI0035A2FCAF